MSRIVFQRVYFPQPAQPEPEIFQFKDRSSYRSLSRAGVMLTACAQGIEAHLERFISNDPFSVGLYVACDFGTLDYRGMDKMAGMPAHSFAEAFQRSISPKQTLKSSAAIAASHLGIHLGVMGPINCYSHYSIGCDNAVDQAEFDLETGVVKAAIVCSAMSTEDPLVCARVRQNLGTETVLAEGAAVILLEASPEPLRWNAAQRSSDSVNYGIATPLIQFCQGKQNG